jgi:hypothetical protein
MQTTAQGFKYVEPADAITDFPAGDQTNWKLVEARTPRRVTSAQMSALTGLVDGQEIELEVDATVGIYWRLRYRSGSPNAEKWEFVGGPPLASEQLASENWTGAVYTDIANSPPRITVPRAGLYDIEWSAEMAGNQVEYLYATPKLGGNAPVDNDAAKSYQDPAGTNRRVGRRIRRQLAANDLVALNYKRGVGTTGVASVLLRNMAIWPVRLA